MRTLRLAAVMAATWALLAAAGIGMAMPAYAGLPEIRLSGHNRVPECVTPSKLMAFVRARNDRLDPRWRDLARHYQSHGEAWRVRWDYAFFQMLVETNYLTFRKPGGGLGDVHPRQNNFAGLGATGGVSGDSFPVPSTGVLAQIQHLVVYSGQRLEHPAAPRTRLKMDEILTKSEALDRPVTFQDLSGRWAVDRAYGQTIERTAQAFRAIHCAGSDRLLESVGPSRQRPVASRPLLSRASGSPQSHRDHEKTAQAVKAKRAEQRPAQRTLVTNALRDRDAPPAAATEKAAARSARPAASRPTTTGAIPTGTGARPERSPDVAVDKTLDKTAEPTGPTVAVATAPPSPPPASTSPIATPAAAAAVPPATVGGAAPMTTGATPPRPDVRCKVFRASYGGPKTVLIQSQKDGLTHFTVLEVTAGREQDQAKAFMDAHARGGSILGEFSAEADALRRTFELCPAQ